MTKKEKMSRQLLLTEIMASQNVSKKKAHEIIEELEKFGLVTFSSSGEFGLRQLGA
ncbi:hypothetical protein ACVR1I_02985 [Streptococcus cameli]